MKATHKLAKNHMLPISGVVLLVSIVGTFLGLGWLGLVDANANAGVMRTLGAWALWLWILGAFGILVGGWYFAEQLYMRRKFERLITTDKRTEFSGNRKTLDDLAKRLPDGYKARVKEKESQFVASKRA